MVFIDHFEPDKVVIDGTDYTQDVLIFGGDVMTWFRIDFDALNESDLQFVLTENAAEVIVGMGPGDDQLVLDDATKAKLSHWPSKIEYLSSEAAVAAFNASGGEAALLLRVRTEPPFEA